MEFIILPIEFFIGNCQFVVVITKFIYNHGWLLAKMRQVCGGDIVRPGATRFAANYIALDSLTSSISYAEIIPKRRN